MKAHKTVTVLWACSKSDILAREAKLTANIKFNFSSIFFCFIFKENQIFSTNYGVIVSAPNCGLISLVPGSTYAFYLQSDWLIWWSAFPMFHQRNNFRFGLKNKQQTNKQTNKQKQTKKNTFFVKKQDIQLRQLAAYLWFRGINSRKKGNLCSG